MSLKLLTALVAALMVVVAGAALAYVNEAEAQVPDNPAAYTMELVQEAVDRYEANGLAETAAYYNTPESRDGQWYVFIADTNGILLSHTTHVGWLIDRVVGPDGYPAGKMANAAATEEGGWVTYTYVNPSSGNVETKHSWVILHDGLLFGSGWYEEGPPKSDAAAYTKEFVGRATNLFDVLGKDEAVAFYNTPESVDGQWYVFIADDANLIAHPTAPQLVGTPTKDVTSDNAYPSGEAVVAVASADGGWTSYTWTNPSTGQIEIKHTWAVRRGGLVFGSGWYEPSPSMDEPEAYTKALVQQAVELQMALGDDAAIEHYNNPEQVHGPWYVFVLKGDLVVGHPDPANVGASLTGPLGTDSTGKEFGSELANATEDGVWVDYVFLNRDTGAEDRKHAWAVKSGDLIFGSGWYEAIPAATPTPVPTATPMPADAPADGTPATGDFSLTSGWAMALALFGALIALGGAAVVVRQRRG